MAQTLTKNPSPAPVSDAGTAPPPLLDVPVALTNRKRWTRTECDFMERAGYLTERYELLDGEIILKVGQNQPHAMSVIRVVAWLLSVFGVARVQTQADIEVALEDQEANYPQPDAVVLTRPDYELAKKPQGTDLLLAVEVSDTTLRDDLRTKAALYARAGVPEYWVLDVPSRRLIVHLRPVNGEYAETIACTEDESIASQAAPDQAVHVSELLPPATGPAAA